MLGGRCLVLERGGRSFPRNARDLTDLLRFLSTFPGIQGIPVAKDRSLGSVISDTSDGTTLHHDGSDAFFPLRGKRTQERHCLDEIGNVYCLGCELLV